MGAVLSLVLPCHRGPCLFGLLDKRRRSVVIIWCVCRFERFGSVAQTRRTVGSGRASAALLFQPVLYCCVSLGRKYHLRLFVRLLRGFVLRH